MEKDILVSLQEISYKLVSKEKMYLEKYQEETPVDIANQVFEYMYSINQKVNEYKFRERMSQKIFKEDITKISINQILNELECLSMYIEENYYYDIANSVKSFFKELLEDKIILNSNPDYTLFTIKIQFFLYRMSIGYSANIKVKNHPEYSKIKELIECRENIIRFFHNKIKVEDYLLEELEYLKRLLLEYDNHINDVERLNDKNLQRILFQQFYTNYNSKLEVLFLINNL